MWVEKHEVLIVANTIPTDHVPANELGFPPGVWVDREDQKVAQGVRYGWRVSTLGELAELVAKEKEG